MDKNQVQPNPEDFLDTPNRLSPQERLVCESLAGGDTPDSQHARALLALDDGATRAEAARLSGLSLGQVKYWLAKFQRVGLGIFSEVPPPNPQVDAAIVEAIPPGDPETLLEGMGAAGEIAEEGSKKKKAAEAGKKKKSRRKGKSGKRKKKDKGKKNKGSKKKSAQKK